MRFRKGNFVKAIPYGRPRNGDAVYGSIYGPSKERLLYLVSQCKSDTILKKMWDSHTAENQAVSTMSSCFLCGAKDVLVCHFLGGQKASELKFEENTVRQLKIIPDGMKICPAHGPL